jgi:hypothetical protein
VLVAVVGCFQGEWGRGGGDAMGDWIVVVVGVAPSACRSSMSICAEWLRLRRPCWYIGRRNVRESVRRAEVGIAAHSTGCHLDDHH